MTEPIELEPSVPPAPSPAWDGWWDAIIAAVLEEMDRPQEERERESGR